MGMSCCAGVILLICCSNAVYAVMILSLTIGFGDFTPETDAGRVVFIVYALMAVPIVTSFAVQTITGLVGRLRWLRE